MSWRWDENDKLDEVQQKKTQQGFDEHKKKRGVSETQGTNQFLPSGKPVLLRS